MLFSIFGIKGFFFTTSDPSKSKISKGITIIGKKFSSNEHQLIQHILGQLHETSDKYLFAVFCVKNVKYNEDQWICLEITKSHAENYLNKVGNYVKNRFGSSAKPNGVEKFSIVASFPDINKNITQKDTVSTIDELLKQCFDEKVFESTLAEVQLSMDVINRLNEKLELLHTSTSFSTTIIVETNSCTYTLAQIFDKGVVEHGLCDEKNARLKQTFERVLSSLESMLKIRPKHTIHPTHFFILCKKLNSANFMPQEGDEVDLRIKTLKLIVQLKENGQEMDEHEQLIEAELRKEIGFLRKGSDIFIKEIQEFDNQLRSDPRNIEAKEFLKLALNDRIEFLSNKNKLVSDLVTLVDILKMFGHFLLEENINSFKKEKKELESKLHSNSSDTTEADIRAAIEAKTNLQKIYKELEYLEVKFSIRYNCLFQELIPVLASKSLDVILPPNFLSKVFVIGKQFISESIVTNIIKLLLDISTQVYGATNLGNFPEQFFAYLTPDTTKQLIDLTNRGFFGTEYTNTLMEFLTTTLIENKNDNLRSSALEAMIKIRKTLPNHFQAVIAIEEIVYPDTEKDFIKEMLNHVQNGYRLTWNCFNKLATSDISEEKMLIIETIIDHDIQKLPTFFVASVKSDISSTLTETWTANLMHIFTKGDLINPALKLCQSMIIAKFLKMSDLNAESFLTLLKSEKYRDNALLIVLTATRMGEIIPDGVVRTVKDLTPKTGLLINCIRVLMKEGTKVDVLLNSKNPMDERKLALQRVVKDKRIHDDYTLQTMMNLVMFDQELRDDVFVAFVDIITPELLKQNSNILSKIIQSLPIYDSKIPIQIIGNLCKKTSPAEMEVVIDYLIDRTTVADDDVQKECIKLLGEILQLEQQHDIFHEHWVIDLFSIVCNSGSKDIKLSVINLLEKEFEIDDFAEYFDSVKIILNDERDEQYFDTLVNMVKRGFIVPEITINTILETLQDSSITSKAGKALYLIHSNQQLTIQTLTKLFSIFETNSKILENYELIGLIIEAMNAFPKFSCNIMTQSINLLNDSQLSIKVKLRALELSRICFTKYKQETMVATLEQQFIKILRELSIDTSLADKNLLRIQRKISLQALMSNDGSLSSDESFIRKYYEDLKDLLILPSNQQIPIKLDDFIFKPQEPGRLEVLLALTITAMYEHQLNINIFIEKPETQWRKELSCDILVRAILEQSEELNEFDLEDFIIDLTCLEAWLNESSCSYRIENVLEYLVKNKCAIPISFEYLSDIFCLIKDKDALDILFSNDASFDTKILTLKKMFIEKCFPQLSANEMEGLIKELIQYQISTLDKLIRNSVDYDSPKNIIDFFKRVRLNLVKKCQDSFLRKIHDIRSVQGWNQALSKEIIENLVQKPAIEPECELAINWLKQKLSRILDSGWSLRSIEVFLDRINFNESECLNAASLSLDTIHEYKLKEYDSDIKGRTLFAIISESPIKNWNKMFRDIAIFQTFPGTYQKPLKQLIEEIVKLNFEQKIPYLRDDERINDDYKKVMESYDKRSTLMISDSNTINKWETKSIKDWAKEAKVHFEELKKESKDEEIKAFSYEAIAVTMQAVQIINQFLPRKVQVLSLLCMLNTSPNKGRLAQINTGEGKTTIIAMLAAIKVVQGHTVDIITSSTELAKPQSIEQKLFYSLFDISVSHNGDDQKDIKERYKSTVLYGAADCFQGDILRDEYSKLGTRSGRKCDLAIVDEVDSMLIDGKNHIVMLSSLMPAMNYLETIMAAIYIHIGIISNMIVERNGKTYFINQQDTNGDDVIHKFTEISVTKADFISKTTENHFRKALRDTEGLKCFPETDREIPNEYTEITIPTHLYDLVTKVQLKKWIGSAIYAMFKCELNKHYVLTEDGKIAPVDATNTGVIQQNMHWNNGLHQFLQIKHGAKITPENLTTNFISNVSFFQRYGANIYGLTGTLGSADSINLLNKTYSVDSVIIPPFKQKQHHELSPVIVAKEGEWYDNIIESTLQKLQHGRGVLIIARYIEQVDTVYKKMIEAGYDLTKIKVYKTQQDSDSVYSELKAGEVIIATNIAGRGTDIKPSSKLEENGGLHVCLTFLPDNKRVEEQNVGRTSRTGNKGTSQFILLEPCYQSLNKLRDDRNQKETKALESAETEIQRVCSKDAIFNKFCEYLDGIDKVSIRPTEERFGVWLQINVDKFDKEPIEELQKLFEDTFIKVIEDKTSNNLIKNICFYNLTARDFIKSKKYKEAIQQCRNAILIDPNFAEIAFFNRAYCRIAEYGGNSFNKKLNKEQVEAARDDLKETRTIINKRLSELQIIQMASGSKNLSKQVKHKMNLYNILLEAIKQAIGLNVQEIDSEIKELKKNQEEIEQNDEEAEGNNTLDNIKDKIKKLEKEKEEDEGGVIGKALRDNRNIQIDIMELEKSIPREQYVENYKDEIEELKSNGIIGSFHISEIKPFSWRNIVHKAFVWLTRIAAFAILTYCIYLGGAFVFRFCVNNFHKIMPYISKIKDYISKIMDFASKINNKLDDMFPAKDPLLKKTGKVTNSSGNKIIFSIVSSLFIWLKYYYGFSLNSLKPIEYFIHGLVYVYSLVDKLATAVAEGVVEQVSRLENTVTNKTNHSNQTPIRLGQEIEREMKVIDVKEDLKCLLMKEILDYLTNRLGKLIKKALEENTNVGKLLANENECFQRLIREVASKVITSVDQIDTLGVKKVAELLAVRISKAISQKQQNTLEITNTEELILDKFEKGILENLNELIDKEVEKADSNNVEDAGDEVTKCKINEISTSISEMIANILINIIKEIIVMPEPHVESNFTEIERICNQQTEAYNAYTAIDIVRSGYIDSQIPIAVKQYRASNLVFMKENGVKAKKIVDELAAGGEAGIVHMHDLSNYINRKIIVSDENGNILRVINEHLSGDYVSVEYHPQQNGRQAHWTLIGRQEPRNKSGGNNCLFDCIAHQTGHDPEELRNATVKLMRENIERLAIVMPEVEYVRRYASDWLMPGGRENKKKKDEILEDQGEKDKEIERRSGNSSIQTIFDDIVYETEELRRRTVVAIIERQHIGNGRFGTISGSHEAMRTLQGVGLRSGFDRGHIVAVSHGGTNDLRNIIPMTPEMNRRGGAYWIREMEIRHDVLLNNMTYHSEYQTFFRRRQDEVVEPTYMYIKSNIYNSDNTLVGIRIDRVDLLNNTIKTTTMDVTPDGQETNVKTRLIESKPSKPWRIFNIRRRKKNSNKLPNFQNNRRRK